MDEGSVAASSEPRFLGCFVAGANSGDMCGVSPTCLTADMCVEVLLYEMVPCSSGIGPV
jgi:hypothetical protein